MKNKDKVTTDLNFENKKPPIGLIPEFIHKELRLREIQEAIFRYSSNGYTVPKSWHDELSVLLNWLNNYKTQNNE